jgi:hypothetical protein
MVFAPTGLTINICLGNKFEGGALIVTGADGQEVRIPQVPGEYPLGPTVAREEEIKYHQR